MIDDALYVVVLDEDVEHAPVTLPFSMGGILEINFGDKRRGVLLSTSLDKDGHSRLIVQPLKTGVGSWWRRLLT